MFDIVIVGAGSAGCAIAARASENPNLNVLLIEAGPDYSDLAATPADLVNGHRNSTADHDWGFSHAPTASRQIPFPRGRVTGGSSAVNTAIALRGMPEDFEEWAAAGLSEWDWKGVLPAYRRLERDLDFGEQGFHGDAGPISIRRYPPAEMGRQHLAFLEAAKTLGYPDCPDANDPDGWGASPMPMNKLGRLRVSCAVGYLAPARIRPNLTILAGTSVRRLVFEGRKCVGVAVGTAGEEVVRGRLVVLSAGAIGSPTLLLQSGVGPRAELEGHSIDVVADVAGVGKNLCDHPAISTTLVAKDPALVDPDQPIIQTILRYTSEGSDKRNDAQIEMISFGGRTEPPIFAIAAVAEYSHGRGELRLASRDPDAAPIIDHRFCEDERDTQVLQSIFRDAIAFARTSPIADLADGVRFPRGEPTAEERAMLCRRFANSGFHPCGTVKMGPASDPMAVVGQFGQCHAIESLVVADASIMPSVPRANTNLTAIMIGEKIGEWLRTRPGFYGL